MNTMLRQIRRSMVPLLPRPVRDTLKQARENHRARTQKLERVAWVVREFAPPRRAHLLRTVTRAWLLPRRTILFYPKHPTRGGIYFKACVLLGYATTDRPGSRPDVAIHYYAGAHGNGSRLAEVPSGVRVLNAGSLDISKQRVQEVFERVFGYSLALDPTIHTGPMVEKSDANGRHDGRVVHGPVPDAAVRPDRVYQKLVHNEDGQGHTVDLRVPIFCGAIPLVYRKVRPVDERFGKVEVRVDICEPGQVLSAEEQAMIARLCRDMGVDLGEMDVLRDNGDGRIYVVDVNNTPDGPPRGLTREGKIQAVDRMSRAFEEAVESALVGER